MAVRAVRLQDWTYRAAKRRMLRIARAQLPLHTATAKLDRDGNRVVDCACGWTGNGLGWTGHLDHVMRGALQE